MHGTCQTGKTNAIFACLSSSVTLDKDVTALIKSIRDFGGRLSNNPIWVLVPSASESDCQMAESVNLDLGVRVIPFYIDKEAADFPYAEKAFGSAHAEKLAAGQADILIWMDSESLVLDSPDELLLPGSKDFAYRPVDITNIGSIVSLAENPRDLGYRPSDPVDGVSRHYELIDAYWKLLYEMTGVSDDRVFTVKVTMDENIVRAYFNAGLFAVRPEIGLLQKWRDNFTKLYLHELFMNFYKKDFNFKLFMHQAVLACTVLSMLDAGKAYELPYSISYSLYDHNQRPAHLRAASLNDIKTCRHYGFFEEADWEKEMAVHEPLRSWIYKHFNLKQYAT